jgi:hypothetical protein
MDHVLSNCMTEKAGSVPTTSASRQVFDTARVIAGGRASGLAKDDASHPGCESWQ